MICRDIVKPSEVHEDFFYEQCSVELFDDDGCWVGAPCQSVERLRNETILHFALIVPNIPIQISSFRVMGPDGIPIKEKTLLSAYGSESPQISPEVGIAFHYALTLHD